VEEVTNYTKAGGGCGKCKEDIARVIREIRQTEADSATAAKPQVRLSMLQKIKLIQETIDNDIRPRLKKDGGDIELLDVDGNTVYVALRGMCANCQMSRVTLRDVVEQPLREFVSPDLVVREGQP
jgi:NifU-like protein